jgi:hypothetical protein
MYRKASSIFYTNNTFITTKIHTGEFEERGLFVLGSDDASAPETGKQCPSSSQARNRPRDDIFVEKDIFMEKVPDNPRNIH